MKLPRIEPNAGHVYIMQSKDLRMKVGSSYVPQARRDEARAALEKHAGFPADRKRGKR